MASTQKTDYLKLNHWNGTDVPQRQDFVNDNLLIDQAVGAHKADMEIHLTAGDRVKLNDLFFTGTYIGNGEGSRVIALREAPKFLILYPLSYPMGKADFQAQLHFNNWGFCTQDGGSYGLSVKGNTLTVSQSAIVEFSYETRRFNQSGVSYQYIAFR